MPFFKDSYGQVVEAHPTSPVVHQQHTTKMSVFTAFNVHAQNCSRCRKPIEVARRGEQLCDEGHNIAVEVARALYKIAGEKAVQYPSTENYYVSLLVDFTGLDGPVYDLCRSMDAGLNSRSSPRQEPAVHYIRPKARQEREHQYSSSPGAYSAVSSSSTSSRRDSRSETPRRTGNIRVNVPIEYGREASYYEEFCHSNGGKVTTKYYHAEAPRPTLSRANTITEVSKPARRSTVHFDPEVQYYT